MDKNMKSKEMKDMPKVPPMEKHKDMSEQMRKDDKGSQHFGPSCHRNTENVKSKK